MSLTVYTLELEAMSPIHVGTGEEFPAYGYIPDEAAKRVYLIDTATLLYQLSPEEQKNFIRAAEKPKEAQDLLVYLWQRAGERLKPAVVREVAATPAFFNTLKYAEELAELEFRPLPVSLLGPYIPGSSLKGALRTAWLFDLVAAKLERQDLVFKGRWEYLAAREEEGGWIRPGRPPYRMNMVQAFEGTILENLRQGRPDHYADPFRAVRVSDSEPVENTNLNRIGIYHPKPGHRLSRAPILAETVRSKTTLRFTLRYHRGLSQRQGKRAPGVSQAVEPQALADAARAFYGELLDMERDFVAERRLENAETMYRTLDERLRQAPELFPLRFGFGTGKFGNTLAFYLDNATEPYTRKTASSSDPRGGLPLGWALATLKPL